MSNTYGTDVPAPRTDPDDESALSGMRRPPQNNEAEQISLGSLMSCTGPSSVYFAEILETGLRAEEYYKPAHATIYRAICDLHAAGEPVEPISVAAKLTERGMLTKIGGAPYLHTCVQTVATAADGYHYAQIVRRKAYLRSVIESAQKILQYAYSEEGDESDVRGLVEQQLTAIVAGTPGLSAAPPLADDLYLDYVTELEAVQNGRAMGLPFGFEYLDIMTAGMQPGNVTVIAAQSGVGKSTLALNAAVNAAKAGGKVLFSSLEMSANELMGKIVAAEGQLALHHLTREGGLNEEGWETVRRLSPDLFRSLPLRIYRPEGASLRDIEGAARASLRAGGLDVLVVDYIQLVEVEQNRSQSREQAVAAVSRGLKNLSVELNCHVIVLSQLNDDGLVRESRAIKMDASVVIKVQRPDAEEKESRRAGEVDFVIEKNRFGATAIVTAAAQLHFSRFTDLKNT